MIPKKSTVIPEIIEYTLSYRTNQGHPTTTKVELGETFVVKNIIGMSIILPYKLSINFEEDVIESWVLNT